MRMVVDTNEVIQKVVYGGGGPSGPITTGFGSWFLDPRTLPYLKLDVEGAKKLLADYPNGVRHRDQAHPSFSIRFLTELL